MNDINFQKQTDKILSELDGRKKLLLHACCAPCSSYVTEYLKDYFDITLYFFNPNIYPEEEYIKRLEEERKLAAHFGVPLIGGEYRPDEFFEGVKGREGDREGGKRCELCFGLRLNSAAKVAKEGNFDFFTTSLTISPLKNATLLNEIGTLAGEKAGVKFLPSDFKKRNGYKRSIQLSQELGFYRQNYCGCVFSKNKE